mmetsp:Transcript_20897/g.67217  ORF Transcript_20897/g.67217 Transcript_20897/m.67217 type:complete len:201 (-) Transcript_20897:71-673(-)
MSSPRPATAAAATPCSPAPGLTLAHSSTPSPSGRCTCRPPRAVRVRDTSRTPSTWPRAGTWAPSRGCHRPRPTATAAVPCAPPCARQGTHPGRRASCASCHRLEVAAYASGGLSQIPCCAGFGSGTGASARPRQWARLPHGSPNCGPRDSQSEPVEYGVRCGERPDPQTPRGPSPALQFPAAARNSVAPRPRPIRSQATR